MPGSLGGGSLEKTFISESKDARLGLLASGNSPQLPTVTTSPSILPLRMTILNAKAIKYLDMIATFRICGPGAEFLSRRQIR